MIDCENKNMDDFTAALMIKALMDKDSFAKALAHFMFREIVEDIHAEGRLVMLS